MATTALADRSASGGPRVAFTSGVWCDAALPLIKHAYRDAVQPYNAEAITVDFENKAGKARKQINEWTRQVTRGLINSVLPPGSIGLTTAIVLGNAIYQEEAVLPPRRRPRRAYVAVQDGFKVLKLHYSAPNLHNKPTQARPRWQQRRRPHEVRHGHLPPRRARRAAWPRGEDGVASESVWVGEFMVPKFKVSFADSVVGILGQLGLRLPFSP
uniref:Serpin domain-containing protein n=2 Tax=Oryza TaxID=4527 RepID=A0A0D3HKN5_9ORYZ